LLTSYVKAQTYYFIPYQSTIPATYVVGGNSIQIDGWNSPSFNNTACNSAIHNWVGGGTSTSYTYQFTKPISDLRLEIQDIEQGEFVELTFNNQQYSILGTDISSFPGMCNLSTTYDISNGMLTTLASTAKNAKLDINPGFPIFSVTIKGISPQGYNGVLYDIYFVNDTCYYPFSAVANTPCEGTNLQLSVDSLPGVTQYDWVKSSTAVSSARMPSLPNIQTTDAGTYFVTATRGNCQYASSVNVTVNSSPAPATNTTTNNGPLCPGSNLQLSTGAVSGVSYIWDGPDNFTSTQQNPLKTNISSLAEGKYYVRTQSLTNGCISKPDSTTLVLFYPTAPPVASGDALVCRGTNINLFATTVPGATYEWTGPGGFYSTQQNPVRTNVTYADSGDYYVITKLNGCSSKPDTVHTSVKILTPPPGASSNSPVCPGTDIKFTAANINNATYNWYGPNFTSTQQNPVISNATVQQAGDYFAYATVNGCISDTEKVNVVIAILAATPEASNNGPVCPGKTLELKANTIPNATYEWAGPNFTSTGQNPVIPNVTTDNAGTYYVWSVINGCKSLPDTTVVKIEVLTPTPDAQSNSPVCRGGLLKLEATNITDATYSWTGPNFSSTAQNPVINKTSVTDSGYYIVTATVDGCKSLPDTVRVAFKPMPDITSSYSNTPVCEGDSIVLTAQGVLQNDKVVYTWTGPGGYNTAPLSQTVRGDVTLDMAGKYFISAYYDGCYSDTQQVDVVVKPKPPLAEITGPGTIRLGETLEMEASGIPAGVDYRWVCPDGVDREGSSISIPDISKAGEGEYKFIVTLDGCRSVAKQYLTVNDRETFILYPNPNEGSFTIKVTLRKDMKIPIEVVNAAGQVVYSRTSETKNKLMLENIDLGHNLTNGLYILRLGLDGRTKDLRFVILR